MQYDLTKHRRDTTQQLKIKTKKKWQKIVEQHEVNKTPRDTYTQVKWDTFTASHITIESSSVWLCNMEIENTNTHTERQRERERMQVGE